MGGIAGGHPLAAAFYCDRTCHLRSHAISLTGGTRKVQLSDLDRVESPFVSFVSEHSDWGFCCVTAREDDQLVNLTKIYQK